MKIKSIVSLLGVVCLFIGCTSTLTDTKIESPSGVNTIEFILQEDGTPSYTVSHNNGTVIDVSTFGFDFKDQPSMKNGFEMIGGSETTINETWQMPWGEQLDVINNYTEMVVHLQETTTPNRKLDIYFRAYDDGVAYRFHFPEQAGVDSVIIMDENSEFQLTGDHMVWWIPGDWDIYEHLYHTTKVSGINATDYRSDDNLAQTYIPENAVNTPVTMRTEDGLHLSFHEANLTDYAGMTLKVEDGFKLVSELVGSDITGYKVKRELPFETPWRSVQISEDAGGLIESRLIVNLNEPNKLGDVSWFKPMKYVGIWWEMHLGVSTWDLEGTQDMSSFAFDELGNSTGVRHGATTENAKRYIDFASENNIEGLLVEGWNTGWDHWIGFEDREGVFDFVTEYEDYDLTEVVEYGRKKGVEVIMHHETSAAPRTYDQQMNAAYTLMQEHGINSVKTGYVGKIIPKGEYHHGQWMVNHYRRALETAAKYDIAINAHEPIKATGIRRTLPNAISREGLRGQEFNAWASDGGNPPEHLPIVAFTRMLAGPIDFTPGIFDIKLPQKPDNQVNTTIAQQLALYVVIYSPIQMAADLPENYMGNPALQFIRDVGVDWKQTKVLNGEVGDFVTIAREERETGNWFVGGITDENARTVNVTFDFLDTNVEYEAVLYRDAADAHWNDNPKAIEIESIEVDYTTSLEINMAEGGGFAISLLKK